MIPTTFCQVFFFFIPFPSLWDGETVVVDVQWNLESSGKGGGGGGGGGFMAGPIVHKLCGNKHKPILDEFLFFFHTCNVLLLLLFGLLVYYLS